MQSLSKKGEAANFFQKGMKKMKDYSLDKEQAKHYIKDFRTVKTEGGDDIQKNRAVVWLLKILLKPADCMQHLQY